MTDIVKIVRARLRDGRTIGDGYASDMADEIERLRALIRIGDVRCERCARPATTLDMREFASCSGCAANESEACE